MLGTEQGSEAAAQQEDPALFGMFFPFATNLSLLLALVLPPFLLDVLAFCWVLFPPGAPQGCPTRSALFSLLVPLLNVVSVTSPAQ